MLPAAADSSPGLFLTLSTGLLRLHTTVVYCPLPSHHLPLSVFLFLLSSLHLAITNGKQRSKEFDLVVGKNKYIHIVSFLGGAASLVAQMVKNPPAIQET